MEMHILSDAQHKELSASLAAIQAILENSTNVVLEGKAPVAKTTSVTKPARRKARGRGVSVLNETKVLEIKRQLASGSKSAAKIAKEFGVHITTINCIKWGKTWKHVQLQQDNAAVAG